MAKSNNFRSRKDYRPVELICIIRTCFETSARKVKFLIRSRIISCLPSTLKPPACLQNQQDASATAVHTMLTWNSEAPLPGLQLQHHSKRIGDQAWGPGSPTKNFCCWIMDFLRHCSQRVVVGSHLSSALRTSTGYPQGYVPRYLLYSLYTPMYLHPPKEYHHKFDDDTRVMCFISRGYETTSKWR